MRKTLNLIEKNGGKPYRTEQSLIHMICQAPKKLKGDYYFEEYGGFIQLLYDLKVPERKASLRQLSTSGILTIRTEDYSFTATMDLEQYQSRYKRVIELVEL